MRQGATVLRGLGSTLTSPAAASLQEIEAETAAAGGTRPPIISFSHFLPRQELLPEKASTQLCSTRRHRNVHLPTGSPQASAVVAPTLVVHVACANGAPAPCLQRMLFYPNLAKASGSDALEARVRALRPLAHVFGHT